MQDHYTPQSNPISKASGIYRITCLTTGKFYIGSAVSLYGRYNGHMNTLRRNEHHNPKLQAAFNKYGENVFIFEVIEFVLVPFLLEREQYWFDKLSPFDDRGFNLDRVAGSSFGREVSQATRDKISAAQIGKPRPDKLGIKPSPEHIENLRLHNLGKKHTEEARRNMGAAQKGRIHSIESREKRRQSLMGHAVSEETAAKIREANKGRRPPPETVESKENRRQAQLGHSVNEETRAKIGAANKGRKQDPETQAASMKTLIVTAPDGTEHLVRGVNRFCKEQGIDPSQLMGVAKGKYKQCKGWLARFADIEAI
jgi:group I intron endonuclease